MMSLAITRDEQSTTAHCRLSDDITKIIYVHVITFARKDSVIVYTRGVIINAETIEKETISGDIHHVLQLNLPPIANWIIRGLNGVPPLSAKQLSEISRTI